MIIKDLKRGEHMDFMWSENHCACVLPSKSYYLVLLSLNNHESASLKPEQARELAMALIKAAEAVETQKV